MSLTETKMFESENHVESDRKDLTEDTTLVLIPLTIVLGMTVAAWLLVYVMRTVGIA